MFFHRWADDMMTWRDNAIIPHYNAGGVTKSAFITGEGVPFPFPTVESGAAPEGDDGRVAHIHAVLGLEDGTVRGGHLLAGEVWPTLVVIVHEMPDQLRKTTRPDLGLALIDLNRTGTGA